MNAYTPPTKNIHRDWENTDGEGSCIRTCEHPDYKPTERQAVIIAATRAAHNELEEAGKYPYNNDVDMITGRLLNIEPENVLRHATEDFNVSGGLFGYDRYQASKYIVKQKLIESNKAQINKLNLSPNLKIGKLKVNCKLAKGCTIQAVSRTGVDLAFSLGNKKYTLFIEDIKRLIGMAKSAGNMIFNSGTN